MHTYAKCCCCVNSNSSQHSWSKLLNIIINEALIHQPGKGNRQVYNAIIIISYTSTSKYLDVFKSVFKFSISVAAFDLEIEKKVA